MGVLEYVCLFVCEVIVHVVGVGVEFLSFGRLKREGSRVMTRWPGQHGCWGCRLNVVRGKEGFGFSSFMRLIVCMF